jgi:NDP-sugar pyrophosphorylase family protein
MKVVIFAAGKGLRLRPLTNTVPKPLVCVAGRPVLSYTMESLPEHISEIHVVIGYRGESIRSYLGDYYHGRKIYYYHQQVLNGTGGAFELIRHLVTGQTMILNADDIYEPNDLLKLANHDDLAILGYQDFGSSMYAMKVENGQLRGFEEVKDSKYVRNAGAYLVNESVKDLKMVPVSVRGDVELSLPHALAELSRYSKIDVVMTKSWWPIGTIEELKIYEKANRPSFDERQ